MPDKPRLLDQVRRAMEVRRYSPRTIEAHGNWVRRFVRYHGTRHSADLGSVEVGEFLTWLASLLSLYRTVLQRPPEEFIDVVRARRPERIPVVLSRDEVRQLLGALEGDVRLICLLLYAAGLRLNECLQLRVKDVDFAPEQLIVRRGKGAKDRMTVLPDAARLPLREHLARRRAMHQADLGRGAGRVALPDGLERKLRGASAEWQWQWVFPATRLYRADAGGEPRRHHLHESVVQRAVKQAVRGYRAGQAGDLPQLPAFVCNPSAGGRLRHPDRAGAAGAPGRRDDHGLHPRPAEGPLRGDQPTRPCVGTSWRDAGAPAPEPATHPSGTVRLKHPNVLDGRAMPG
jgi:integrase